MKKRVRRTRRGRTVQEEYCIRAGVVRKAKVEHKLKVSRTFKYKTDYNQKRARNCSGELPKGIGRIMDHV